MENILSFEGYDDENCVKVNISKSISFGKKNNKKNLPWIEKYRPKNIDDVILDKNILIQIKKIISEKDMQNIIITGIPGTGKTTTIKCIGRALYGKFINSAVLELNASDDRGIRVEEPITNFCKNMPLFGQDVCKHKMIILDEADNITPKAQHAIIKKMKEYDATTRFAFTCNDSGKIIDAIQSRCIIFRYVRLTSKEMLQRLRFIAEKENFKIDDEILNEIIINSQGDMRTSINTLQKIHNSTDNVTIGNFYKICDKPQPMLLKNLLIACKEKNIQKSFNILGSLKDTGYSNSDIVLGIINFLKLNNMKYHNFNEINEHDKIVMFNKLCPTAYITSRGINTDLQLYSCISNIILCYFGEI